MSAWDQFFLAEAGASAVLAGLLFVAISLNMSRILTFPALPNVALRALGLFATIFVISSLMLVPGQTSLALGSELLVTASAAAIVNCWLAFEVLRTSEPKYRAGGRAGLAAVSAVSGLYIAAAFFILDGASIGVYLLVGPVLTSILLALMDSWVLLVEINR